MLLSFSGLVILGHQKHSQLMLLHLLLNLNFRFLDESRYRQFKGDDQLPPVRKVGESSQRVCRPR